ncbi:hypothetical protein Tco_0552081, partial [Tanacetum coccineum]
ASTSTIPETPQKQADIDCYSAHDRLWIGVFPHANDTKRIRYKNVHKAARKYVKRAFDVEEEEEDGELEEDEDKSRSCCADEEELDRKEMTKQGLKNGIFDDSLDDFSATALKRHGSRTNGNFCLDVGVQRWYRLFSSGYRSMLIKEQMRSLLSLCLVSAMSSSISCPSLYASAVSSIFAFCSSEAVNSAKISRKLARGGSHNEKESPIGFLEAWKIPGVAPFAVSVEYLRKDQRCQDKVEEENGVRDYYLHSAPIFGISGYDEFHYTCVVVV